MDSFTAEFSEWALDLVCCRDDKDWKEEDEPGALGALLLSRSLDRYEPTGALVTFSSPFGLPVHMPPNQLFVRTKVKSRSAVLAVPEQCVFRLASSPLQHVWRDARSGELRTRAHDRVPVAYAHAERFRSVQVQVRASQLCTRCTRCNCDASV